MVVRCLLIALLALVPAVVTPGHAQDRKPTAKEIAAISECAAKYTDDVEEGERQCVFNLVATPCLGTSEGASNLGSADCYRVEGAIWDDLLNANFKSLLATLEAGQATKLRAMQRAWIASRDATCQFYYDKTGGSLAIPMSGACVARETARRALLLKFFEGL